MKSLIFTLALPFLFASCMSEKDMADKMAKVLKENPKVLTDAIEANPADVVLAFQKAVKEAQDVLAKRREEDEKKQLEETFDKPLQPKIRDDEAIRGEKGAPITLVEYSDFECPFCSRGFETVMDLMKEFNGKIRFVYKHLPLSFHQQAMIASQYYEALRMQSHDLAFKFHDEIYKNQKKLRNGEAFLKETAKKVGANMDKLAKDHKSQEVIDRIQADLEEAASFGMQGTPGFLINGIPVRGAYPAAHFKDIVKELEKRGLVKL
jgi:protein-disulfide isomerase